MGKFIPQKNPKADCVLNIMQGYREKTPAVSSTHRVETGLIGLNGIRLVSNRVAGQKL